MSGAPAGTAAVVQLVVMDCEFQDAGLMLLV